MSEKTPLLDEVSVIKAAAFDELTRRVKEIEQAYRSVARRMGQLYMFADQHDLVSLTQDLDKPMRDVSANERTLAAILETLQIAASRGR